MSDYSSTYPTQSPVFAFDAKAGKLDSRLSYSRSSGGTYMSSERHLSSENLLTYSNPNDAAWTEGGLTVTTDQTTSPDGTSNASALTEDSSTGIHRTFFSTTVNSGDSLTVVGYLKANGRSIVQVGQTGTYGTSIWVEFDLSGSGSSVTRFGSPTNVSIAQVGSTGWYKISYSSTTTSSGTHYTQLRLCDAADSPSYTGDGTSGIYAYGLNLSSNGQLVTDATSGQIHREFAPLLKTAAADAARFEYATDGQSVGTPKGLLVESQASNLARYGSDVANWVTMSNVDVTTNAAVAPNSELEADLVVATSAASYHYVYDNAPTISSGTVYTASVYVKDAAQRYVQFIGASNVFGLGQYATFDLQTGSVDANGVTASSENVGNGWYRIQIAMTATAAGNGSAFLALANSATASRAISFTGDNYSGVLIWGFQIETGSAASSLANSGTSSSGVTRAADSCSVDLTSVGNEVTVAAEAISTAVTSDRETVFQISPTGSNNLSAYAGRNVGGGTINNLYGGLSGVYLTGGTVTAGTPYKFALRSAPANHGISLNGGTVATETTTVSGDDFDTLHIGSRSDGSNAINGHVKRLSLYSAALSNVELQSLTS